MSIAQIMNQKIHWITPYKSMNDLPDVSPSVIFMEVPVDAKEGYILNGDKWVDPDTLVQEEPVEDVITFQTLQARAFASEWLGIDFVITPEESLIVSRSIGLPPIKDGKSWTPGLNLTPGTIVEEDGRRFVVRENKGHISQPGWNPSTTPALFEEMREQYIDWSQPLPHEAWMSGDRVRHNSRIWESEIDFNVWEPGVHGWKAVSTEGDE